MNIVFISVGLSILIAAVIAWVIQMRRKKKAEQAAKFARERLAAERAESKRRYVASSRQARSAPAPAPAPTPARRVDSDDTPAIFWPVFSPQGRYEEGSESPINKAAFVSGLGGDFGGGGATASWSEPCSRDSYTSDTTSSSDSGSCSSSD